MSNIDSKDMRILRELDIDARRSNSEIGRKLRISKEVVKYRIDRLVESGVIVNFVTITNYFRLGISKYKLYLRLRNVDTEKQEEIGNYFKGHRKTEWVITCTGRWDMIVGFLVNNVNEFDEEIQNMMNRFSTYIQEKAVTTTLHLVHHLREYLKESPERENASVVFHTTADKQVEIDETDKEIIRILTKNARIPIRVISKRLGLTPRIVHYRMKRMEREGVILAYKILVDPKKMGNIFCKAIVYLASSNKESIERFVSYCSSIPEAVWPQRVIGNWDFELDFEIESYDRFQERMFEIKEKFSEIIQNYEFIIVSKEFKLDFFPDCYPVFS
jgi:DNA-binding Lrp family transcriptional regulator